MLRLKIGEIKRYPIRQARIVKLAPNCIFKWNEVLGFDADPDEYETTLDIYVGASIIQFEFNNSEQRLEYMRRLELIISGHA